MKRILICILLVLLCVGCLFACDKKKDKTTTAATTTVPSTPAVTTTVPPAQTTTTAPQTPTTTTTAPPTTTTTTTVPQVPTTTVDPTIPDPSSCTHTANTNPLLCEDEVTCSVCGDAIGAVGHVYAPSGDHVDGNCKTPGHQTFTCLLCGHSFEEMDSENGLHQYAGGVCTVCNTSAGTTKIEQTDADIVIMPDRYNTGAGSIAYRNEEIVKVEKAGVYNGFTVIGTPGSTWAISLAGMDPQNNEIVVSNLDLSSATFVGCTGYGTLTEKTTVRFVNCIFKGVNTDRSGDTNKMYLYLDHCTLKIFTGSNVTLDWCYFGGNDYVDAMNPFQNVTVLNTYVGEKDSVKYDSEMHTDATQIYGYGPAGKQIIAKNQLYYNFRGEMPSVKYTGSMSYTNSILMISLDYNDADSITFDHCYINGGGVPIMVFDNPHTPAGTFKMTNILYQDIRYGCSMQFHIKGAFKITSESQVDMKWDTIVPTSSLLVGSVWTEGGKTHVSVTNDTNQTRELTVVTDKGVYSFTVEGCPFFVEFEIDQAFAEFPFDVKCTIDKEVTWAVCYDSTNGVLQQIRFYNPTDAEVEIGNDLLYGWTNHQDYYEVAHGRTDPNIYWKLYSDGTLYIEQTDNEHSADGRRTVNTPKSGYSIYKEMVKHVVVKPGITAISASQFANYTALETVSLPSTVKSIGNNAFGGCQALRSVNIPYGVKDIGNGVFSDCVSLSSATVPSTVTSMGARVFAGCVSLESVVFAANVAKLPDNTFDSCYKLASVTLTDSVALLGNKAFYLCPITSLTYAGAADALAKLPYDTNSHFLFVAAKTATLIDDSALAASEDRDLAQREPQPTTLETPSLNKVYDQTPVSYLPVTNSDGEVTLKWMRGSIILDSAPTDVGRYQLVVKIAETESHQAFFGTYTFYIYEAKGTLEITTASLDKVYDGKPLEAPAFETNSNVEPTVVWTYGDTVCASAPSLPGVYTVTVTVPKSDNYSEASDSMTVTISSPAGVSAWLGGSATAFAGGTGTEADPYLIATAEQLAYLAKVVNDKDLNATFGKAHYRLTRDIFLNEGSAVYASWALNKASQVWTSIGLTETTPFGGTFDGAGFAVYGMCTASGTAQDYYGGGLFGYLKGAEVKNLTVGFSAAVSTGSDKNYFTGAVASFACDSVIRDVHVTDSVIFAKYNGGGIIGGAKAAESDVVIEGCTVSAKIYASGNNLYNFGGILGRAVAGTKGMTVTVRSCTAEGEVLACYQVGGIVGYADANTALTVDGCINYASVTATSSGYAGGIVSRLTATKGGYPILIQNCSNYGTVTASASTGKYAGGLVATVNLTGSGLVIYNSANYGTVTAPEGAGGIIAQLAGGTSAASTCTVTNVISLGEVTASSGTGAVIGVLGLTHNPTAFAGVWHLAGYPAVSDGTVIEGIATASLVGNTLLEALNEQAASHSGWLTWKTEEGRPVLLYN